MITDTQSEQVTSFKSIKLHNLAFKKFLSKQNPGKALRLCGQLGQGVAEKAAPPGPEPPEPSPEQGPRAQPPTCHHTCLFSSSLDKPPSKRGAGSGRGPSGWKRPLDNRSAASESLGTSIGHVLDFRMPSPASVGTQKPCGPRKGAVKRGPAKEQRSRRQLHQRRTAGSGLRAATRPPSDSSTPVNSCDTSPL